MSRLCIGKMTTAAPLPELLAMASRHGMIKALLKRYKYPPDQEPAAIELVLQQTEMISEEWASEDLGDKTQAAVADAPPSDGP